MKIGIISDTHNFLDPRVATLFRGVNHIVHAGDIGSDDIIVRLQKTAPVTAFLGNNDGGLHYKETEALELGGRSFLVHHIVQPTDLLSVIARRIARNRPDFLIYGHTHQQADVTVNGVRFINPGYAGSPRFGQNRSVAILELSGSEMILHFHQLPTE